MAEQRVEAPAARSAGRRTTSRWAWPSVVGLLVRLVTGAVFVWAGWLKIGDPEGSVTAVRAYQLLPPGLADVLGRVLPPLEIAVGVCLLVGLLTRLAGGLSALLQVAFVIGVSSVWIRHIAIECGCFNKGGAAGPEAFRAYPWEIARDVGLFVLSMWLVVRPHTPLALDRVLFPQLPDPAEDEHAEER